MPRIATVEGLVVKLYFNDHPPPHVHVHGGRHGRPGAEVARISIDTGEILSGRLAAVKAAAVRDWCRYNRVALLHDWQRAQANVHPLARYDQP